MYMQRLLIAALTCLVNLILARPTLAQFPDTGTNVALASNGGTATASSVGNWGGPHVADYAIDGSWTTDWAGTGTPDWLQVDFNGAYLIERVAVRTQYHTQTFHVDLSLDGVNWTRVVDTWTTPDNQPSGTQDSWYQQFHVPAMMARHIKYTVIWSDAPPSHILQDDVAELEATTFHRPSGTNVALQSQGGVATAGTIGSYGGVTHWPHLANDGNMVSDWAGTSMPDWLMVEFNNVHTVTSVGVSLNYLTETFDIELSVDGVNWVTVVDDYTSPNLVPSPHGELFYGIFSIAPTAAKFIRYVPTWSDAYYSHIFKTIVGELEAWAGQQTNTISLTGPATIFAGSPAAFAWTNAEPKSTWFFLASLSATGSHYYGHDFDVGPLLTGLPVMQGSNTASGSGAFVGTAPASLRGKVIYVEIASLGTTWEDSNMLSVLVL